MSTQLLALLFILLFLHSCLTAPLMADAFLFTVLLLRRLSYYRPGGYLTSSFFCHNLRLLLRPRKIRGSVYSSRQPLPVCALMDSLYGWHNNHKSIEIPHSLQVMGPLPGKGSFGVSVSPFCWFSIFLYASRSCSLPVPALHTSGSVLVT